MMRQDISIELVVPANKPSWWFWAEFQKIWLERHGYQTTIVERADAYTATWYFASTTQPSAAEARTLAGLLTASAQMVENRIFHQQLTAMALNGATS